MAQATNTQIQRFADERLRPWAEQLRALYLAAKDHRAAFDDVYQALATDGNPNNWADQRADGPPHLLAASDVLAMNTMMAALVAFVEGNDDTTAGQGNDQYPVALKLCVRPVQQ